ncbi:MAG: amidohydrolase family protein [Methanobacterium sp.]|uniref:amidohydrolase family protein n=1 Tax=Methanobacterium sp. TaxID=2164 RepID=UPI003C785F2B
MKENENTNNIQTIGLEEHYATPLFMEGPGRQLKAQAELAKDHPEVAGAYALLVEQLMDLDNGRIAEMDKADIDMQALSLTSPGVEQLGKSDAISLAKDANNILGEAVLKHPSRFIGFATLATIAPETAADELERTVKEYNFKGGIINGHIGGRYLDDDYFWPILERAEALNVPIYLHPTPPPESVVKTSYAGNYPPEIAGLLASAAWGWHIETAIHILRIILSGAFDQFPKLQFIIGHMGETLPFMLPRLDRGLPKELTKLERSVGDYLTQNINYTFSGFNYTQNFLDLFLQVGVERIMFSADYPYSSMAEAKHFLDNLPVSAKDKKSIAHGNAERLLKL